MHGINEILTCSLLSLAILYLLLGLDDLLIDLVAFKKKLKPRELSEEDKIKLDRLRQKKIAILVPAWRESNIISKMLRGNLGKIAYENVHFFVGCYPNDLATFRAVTEVSRATGKVTPILNSLPGPTSKGQLLNSVVHELLENHYPCFEVFLFHDAEDIIHPLSLKVINSETDRADFVQIPVFSLPIPRRLSVGATYMDEFAEVHTRDLLVRKSLEIGIPSAGVGFALTRKGLFTLLEGRNGNLFDSSCLTEDYILGLRAHQLGLRQSFPCLFEWSEDKKKEWVATYEYFPKQFIRSVRQKARWTEGISLQAAKKLGWFGSFANCLFLFRDRKALVANCLGFFGLVLFPIMPWGLLEEPILAPLLATNFVILCNRLFQRAKALKRVYPSSGSFEVLFRYPLAVIVNGLAGFLAIKNYSESLVTKEPSAWVKTEHELPEDFGRVAVREVRATP